MKCLQIGFVGDVLIERVLAEAHLKRRSEFCSNVNAVAGTPSAVDSEYLDFPKM